jgi:hypothetical protein
MGDAAESLMKTVTAGLLEPDGYLWLAGVVAECLRLPEDLWLRETARQFVTSGTMAGKRPWAQFVTAATGPSPRASSDRVNPVRAALSRDEELLERVIALHLEMQRDGSATFFDERRRSIRSRTPKGNPRDGWDLNELRALDFLETNLVEIERQFELVNKAAEISIRVAIQVFDRWVNERLRASGLSSRLVLDRLTSTHHLVPREACSRLDDPSRLELRDIQPHTVLSACLIAYLTLAGIDGRVEEWVEGLSLVDRLGFAGILERFLRCQVCGTWVYAVYSRRDYCGDKCRYRVWMKTPKGLEKRRRASSAWRSRYSEEVRKATPDVKRRKGTP